MSEPIFAQCHICGNQSGYDEQALKGSTHKINGCVVILCCPCEDDMFLKFLKARLSEKRMKDIASKLMSEERDDLLALYEKH